MHALDGVRVLDLTRLTPGAYATLQLADLGADVIKVEEPRRGDYMRELVPAGYEVLNRNKRSISIDLKTPAGRDLLLRLATASDVVIENFRPGVMDRLGVGYDSIRAVAPRVIYCAMTGYGQSGAYRLLSGHDLNYQGLSGFATLFGSQEEPIRPTGIALGDLNAAIFAALSVVSALVLRERTGTGQYLDVSITDVLMSMTSRYLAEQRDRNITEVGSMTHRIGYGVFRTSDDRSVSLGCIEDMFWHRFLDSLEADDDLHGFRDRTESMDIAGVNELVAKAIAQHDREYWIRLGSTADIPLAPANLMNEVGDDEVLRERGLFHDSFTEAGGVASQVRYPVVFSDAGPHDFRPAPTLGQHTDEVLIEFGVSDTEINELRAVSAVR